MMGYTRHAVAVLVALLAFGRVWSDESFDYGRVSEKRSTEYDGSLGVMIEGVNTLDYTYEFKIEVELPKPVPPLGGGPVFPGGPRAALTAGGCADELNKKLLERLAVFGTDELRKWHAAADPTCADATIKARITQFLQELAGREDIGRIAVPADTLRNAVRQTGPGGSVTITVTAKPLRSVYDDQLQRTQLPFVDSGSELTPEQTKLVEKHMEPRTFKLEFGPPRGVTFSFGPYAGGIERTEFDQVRNATFDPTDPASSAFVIGRSEHSSFTYGVAAYWNAPMTDRENFGISWGVAYALNNELDTAVSGLMGVYYQPRKKGPGMLHAGLAVGRENELDGGRTVGGPIGETEEIPTTEKTKVSWFVGYGFLFGK